MRDSRFDIWAPRARSLRLLADGVEYEMHRSDERWWRPTGLPDLPEAGPRPEVDYGYLLDDETAPLPDPRSLRQPHGVHELSRTFDTRAHDWQDSAWGGRPLAGGVVYELHVGTFTPGGTLDSAIDKLDHLAALGIDFVELMPVNAFNGDVGWGYDGVAWFAVHEPYGGPAAYQRFVDAAHQRGLGVIQDVVYNHLGPSGNYLPRFGPYLGSQHQTPWGDGINLDGVDSDQVRHFISDNVLMWFTEFHVDGLRLDAVHALIDTRATHLLEELANRVDARAAHLRRPLTLIAESDLNNPRLITPRSVGGYALTAQWSDDFHHAAHVCLTGESDGYYADFAESEGDGFEALAKVLTHGFYHDGSLSTFRHRHHGRPLPRNAFAWRLVASTQNHDQIGNRASGDRLSATLTPAQLAVGATLLACAPFTPMLFMGEEWGATTPFAFFSSHPEPELAEAVTRGRIDEFSDMGWNMETVPDPQDRRTFERSRLNWEELDVPARAGLLKIWTELLALRRAHPELSSPWLRDVSTRWDADARTFSFWRGDLQIALNFAAEPREVPVDVDVRWTSHRELPELLFATTDRVEVGDDSVLLPAHSAAVLGPLTP